MADQRYIARKSSLRMVFWVTLGLATATLGRFSSPSLIFYVGVFFCGANFAVAHAERERES